MRDIGDLARRLFAGPLTSALVERFSARKTARKMTR